VKRNDVLLRGFGRFVRDGAARDPLLALPANTDSRDIELARRIVAEEDIVDRVLWLDAGRPAGFSRSEMVDLYSAADVVADDFGVGWFGFVVLEALAVGTPVVSYVDEAVMRQLYPWHPVCSAREPGDVAAALGQLHGDAAGRARLSERGRAWVEEFHSPAGVRERYAAAVRAVAARSG
jgi:glycosyltransferase involved in cell wall biosynthesis